MTTPQQNGAYRLVAADVVADRARVYNLEVATICGRCDWRTFGAPEAGRAAFEAHRAEHHPSAVDRGQKARQVAKRSARAGYWSGAWSDS